MVAIILPRKRHCRCPARRCQRRVMGIPGVTKCRSCSRVVRLDRWAAAKPWRARMCYCDAYHFPHRRDGGACVGPRIWPDMPGIAGLPF